MEFLAVLPSHPLTDLLLLPNAICITSHYIRIIIFHLNRIMMARRWSLTGRRTGSVRQTLPRHVPCGLNQQKCTRRCIQIYGMCRESVDSFSLYVLQYCALTIFPCSSATKAISIAINGSPGRTIDRFSWCEPHRFFCLLNLRVNEHFDIFPY